MFQFQCPNPVSLNLLKRYKIINKLTSQKHKSSLQYKELLQLEKAQGHDRKMQILPPLACLRQPGEATIWFMFILHRGRFCINTKSVIPLTWSDNQVQQLIAILERLMGKLSTWI